MHFTPFNGNCKLQLYFVEILEQEVNEQEASFTNWVLNVLSSGEVLIFWVENWFEVSLLKLKNKKKDLKKPRWYTMGPLKRTVQYCNAS